MILLDTGPLVALFDPADDARASCVEMLQGFFGLLATNVLVLAEAFHLLALGSRGAMDLIHFIADGGLAPCCFDAARFDRAFERMQQYVDHPMDLTECGRLLLLQSHESA